MEKLNISGITLEGFAQGGVRTSIVVPEIKAIFDMGTIVPGSLKYNNIFITHGHPDHIGALNSLIGRRMANRMPVANIYVPKVIEDTLKEIFRLWSKIQGPNVPIDIIGVQPGDRVPIGRGHEVLVVPTYHRIPSVGYVVERTTQRLMGKFAHLDGPEIGKLVKTGVEVKERHREFLLAVPGDTTIDFLVKCKEAQHSRILVHEVTVWDDRSDIFLCRKYGHTHIEEMLEHCNLFRGKALVLCHRSMKIKRAEIEKIAKERFSPEMMKKVHFFDGGDRC